jgi:uncharacterized protein involved in response to NO
LIRAGNRRNYFFIVLLLVIAASELVFSMAQRAVVALPPWLGFQIALDIILLMMTVMAGRVIPMFTNTGVLGANARRSPPLEKLVLAITIAVPVRRHRGAVGHLFAALATIAAVTHGARLLM